MHTRLTARSGFVMQN